MAAGALAIGGSALAIGGALAVQRQDTTAPAPTVAATPAAFRSVTASDLPTDRDAAARFLLQATFGAHPADIDRLMTLGYAAWIDEQLDPISSPPVGLMAHIRAIDPGHRGTNVYDMLDAFYGQVVTSRTPLRDRLAFELSKIFVVSSLYFLDGGQTASYVDMLATAGTTTFRNLLEAVTLHPTMGLYLSSLGNQKENDQGRIPDQNYAREVQQLFSIGLYKMNPDGSLQTDRAGNPIPVYGQDDVIGLSRVLTGYSYAGPDKSDGRFFYGGRDNPDQLFTPMQFYPKFHSTAEKRFLGVTIPAGGDGAGDLALALDTLARHPNTAPNMSKQLIQRFVTSNPTPAYVARVANTFVSSGGDMKAILKAILLDPEARDPARIAWSGYGKVREPLLRIFALLRGFGGWADGGSFLGPPTDDPGTSYGQSPLRAPSVFNFYRPTYTPPLSRTASRRLVAPEMQILHEVTIVGYANALEYNLSLGFGFFGSKGRPRIQLPFCNWTTAAEFAASEFSTISAAISTILATINRRLFAGQMAPQLQTRIALAIDKIKVPVPTATGSNQAAVDTARKARVKTALFLAMVSPQFHVQR